METGFACSERVYMERVWKVFPRMELESVLLVVSQVIIANIDPRGRPLTSPTISSVL